MNKVIISRQSILEVALLAIFALGLFVSKIIVDYKNRITMGPAISLASSGVSVHLPEKNGWRGLKDWQLEQDNSFVLAACLMGRSNPTVDILWKYMLASSCENSRQVLDELAAKSGDTISKTDYTPGNCPMEYTAYAISHSEQQYLGAIMLDFGRVLILQVKGQVGSPVVLEDVFFELARGLQYKKPDEMAKGVDFLKKAQAFGMDLFSSGQSRYYLARDASGNIRGYETLQARIDSQRQLHITRQTSLTAGVVGLREHQFESVSPLERFNWRCRNSTNARSLGSFGLEFDEQGNMTVQDTLGRTRLIRPGPAMAGEILLDWLVRYFLETEEQKITVDILYFDGQIVPTQIFLLPQAQATGKAPEMAFAVRMESPGRGAWEFYFDSEKQLLGKISIELPRTILLWDSVDAAAIEQYFNFAPKHKGPTARLDMIKGKQI